MVGREEEKRILQECLNSSRPEFIAVYGRRRVGKTYLIKMFFQERFSFYATGVAKLNTRKQLNVFRMALMEAGDSERTIPRDWLEAFSRLKEVLSSPNVVRDFRTGKRVVFLDEVPWMDTARSDFRAALDYFWNSWGSMQSDLVLIVCGSATSWIINHIVNDTGGFYNRVTRQIHLMPFCLNECRQMLRANGVPFSDQQVIESYMIFGGIPYYLNYLRPEYSLAQNVELLFFRENGPLRNEYDQLFHSLFKKAENHLSIITALSTRKSGMTRVDLIATKRVPEGKELTKCLNELEQCGFIRSFQDFTKKENGRFYQLVDALTLFHLAWLEPQATESWMDVLQTPAYFTWRGLAFGRVCMLHTRQIMNRLGVLGVSSHCFSWRSKKAMPGTQIDLILDRKDGIVNLCEVKYSSEPFTIDSRCEEDLLHKLEAFRAETGTKKALHLTMITSNGLSRNSRRGSVVSEITGEDLLRELPPFARF